MGIYYNPLGSRSEQGRPEGPILRVGLKVLKEKVSATIPERRCGEVKRPVFKPRCLRMDSQKAQVEPFPLVPLTWITPNLSRSEIWSRSI